MDIQEAHKKIENLKLPEEQKGAILGLIDIKINGDMEKFALSLEGLKNELKTENNSLREVIGGLREGFKTSIDASIGSLKAENNSLRSELKSENNSLRDIIGGLKDGFKSENNSLRSELGFIKWTLMAALTVLGVGLTVIALLIAFKN